MGNKHIISDLYQMQSLPLSAKVRMTEYRVREWINEFGENGVYVSFSGGKDSTVLLDIVRKSYPNVRAMFVDVSTQYPELKQFVMGYENVDIVKSDISFAEVCKKYGFPMISKEVSGCVEDARKYLARILQENTISERASKPISIASSVLLAQADIASMMIPTRGGQTNYRKLRGIGEYARQSGNVARDVDKEQSDKSKYP